MENVQNKRFVAKSANLAAEAISIFTQLQVWAQNIADLGLLDGETAITLEDLGADFDGLNLVDIQVAALAIPTLNTFLNAENGQLRKSLTRLAQFAGK